MLLGSIRIKVLIAEDQDTAGSERPLLRHAKCTGVAEVQEAGGGWSQAAAVRAG
jgi:hypothetical protein